LGYPGVAADVKKYLKMLRTTLRRVNVISYARKPQAFKPGDEWHPFEAEPGETWRSGANSGMIWLWPDI
jgi:hypothetical protein